MIRKVAGYVPPVLVAVVLNALLVYLYANAVTPAEYGLLNLTLNTIAILYAAVLSFLQSSALRFYTADGAARDERAYLSTYVLGNLAFGTVLGLLLVLVGRYVYNLNYALIAFAVAVNGVFQFYLSLFRLRDAARHYARSRIAASILTVGLFVAFMLWAPGLSHVHAVVAMYGAYALVVAVELFHHRRDIHPRWFSIDLLRRSTVYGVPLMGASVLGLLLAYSDQYLILHFLSKTDVGYYALGYRLSEMTISNATSVVLLVMTPVIMRSFDLGDVQSTERSIASTITMVAWLVLPLCAVFVAFAAPLVRYVFPGYAAASGVVQLVPFASALNSLAMVTCKGLELTKRTVQLLMCLLAAAVINVAYNVVFIPVYGVMAAAHSSVIAYAVYNVLLIAVTGGVRVRFEVSRLGRTAVLALGIVVLATAIQRVAPIRGPIALVVEVTVCAGVYLLATYRMRILRGIGEQ